MNIVVWSDFLCPYCILGKKQLENALEATGIKDAEIEIRSFLLNPASEGGGTGMREHLKHKYGYTDSQVDESFEGLTAAGLALGIPLNFETARHASTDQAHALFQFAKSKGLGTAFSDRLQRAGYQEGRALDDEQTLLELAAEVGLDPRQAEQALKEPQWFDKARGEYAESLRYGARGVPFFVIDERYAISGAQPKQVFINTLKKAAGR